MSLRLGEKTRRPIAGALLACALLLPLVAARRLALLERRPQNSTVFFVAFALSVILALIAGRMTALSPAASSGGSIPAPVRGGFGSLRFAAAVGTLLCFGWAWVLQGRLDHPLTALAFWAVSLALGAVAFAVPGPRTASDARMRAPVGVRAAVLLVLIAAAWARLAGLDRVPATFGGDEANQVMDGISLIRGAQRTDPFGTGWTSSMRIGMLPGGVGAMVFKDPIIGPRRPYAVAGILSVVAAAAAAGILAGGWGALGSAALLAFAPHHVHFSRLSSIMILDALFAALTVVFLLAAHRYGSPFAGYLAGLCAGLSLYGYSGGRVVPIAFLMALPFVVASSRGARKTMLVAMVAAFILAAAPNVRFAVHHFAEWNGRFNQVGIFNPAWWTASVRSRGSPAKVLTDQFVESTIGLLCEHSTSPWYQGYPIVAPAALPALALAGFGWMAGRRRYFAAALLASIAAGNIAGVALTQAAPTPQRPSSLVPILAIAGGVAIAAMLGLLPARDRRGIPWRPAAGTLLIGGLLVGTFHGPPGLWDPSPGYGAEHAAFVQGARELLGTPRYRGETVYLHGLPYVNSSFPLFEYFLPDIRWIDVETQADRMPREPGVHLFSPEWRNLAAGWSGKARGTALAELGDPLRDVGYVLWIPPAPPLPSRER